MEIERGAEKFCLQAAQKRDSENKISVMPVWIAGIQACKDAFGDIHVNLDSTTPCWNDGIRDSA
jgi:hypothetical protein